MVDKQCAEIMLVNGYPVRCEYWDYEHVSHYSHVNFSGVFVTVRWGGTPEDITRQEQRDMEAKAKPPSPKYPGITIACEGALTHHLCAGCECECHTERDGR